MTHRCPIGIVTSMSLFVLLSFNVTIFLSFCLFVSPCSFVCPYHYISLSLNFYVYYRLKIFLFAPFSLYTFPTCHCLCSRYFLSFFSSVYLFVWRCLFICFSDTVDVLFFSSSLCLYLFVCDGYLPTLSLRFLSSVCFCL